MTLWSRVVQRLGRGHPRVGGAVAGMLSLLVIAVLVAVGTVMGGSGEQPNAAASAGSPSSSVVAAEAPKASVAPPPGPPAPAASVKGLGRSTPVRVQIPSIGVNSDLMQLGLAGNGTMEVPPSGFPAGWFTGAPTPGQIGPAVIAGHVDWAGAEGVFFNLREVKTGDKVDVARADGSTAVFNVSAVEEYPKDAFPTNKVYGDLDHPGLRVITCGGSFDHAARSYVDNIVVYADLQ